MKYFKPHPLFPDQFSRSLFWGYALLFFLLSLSIGGFLVYNHTLQAKQQQAQKLYHKEMLLEQHINLAQERSITLIKMFNTDDFFVIDALQQKMRQLESQIGKTRQKMLHEMDTPVQKQALNDIFLLVKANKKLQNQVYNLIMADKKQQALDLLINQTFAKQEAVIHALNQLKNHIYQQYLSTKMQSQHLFALMDKLVLLAGLIPMTILVLIGWFSIRKIQFHEQKQRQFRQELEQQVKERTQELQLDRALFEQIHEAIVLAKENGSIIKSNHPFQKLLLSQGRQLDHQQTNSIWQLLHQLFNTLDISHIQTKLKQHAHYQKEVQLSITPHTYYQLSISLLHAPDEQEKLISIVLNDISEQKTSQNKLEKIAKTDTVTQLQNRFALNQTLENHLALHTELPFTLILLDLDHFKAINDHFGHEEGDRLLKAMADILKHTLAIQTLNGNAFRIGGDEFVVYIRRRLKDIDIAQFCETVLRQANHLSKDWKKLGFGCSLGVARYPEDAQNRSDLLRYADQAMYQAKQQGRNHYQIFNTELKERIHYIASMQTHMQQAIQVQAFQVYFQPQFKLQTMELCGAEALLRWPTDDGMISPVEFIPLAEKFDLINELGSYVLNESLRIFCDWQRHGNQLPRIAINVSAMQIASQSVGPALKEALKIYPVHPAQLDFEITESVLMENKDEKYLCLSYLEQSGCEISIDDFGTGYSSLAYIHNLNVNRIKIDRSFVKDLAEGNASYNIINAIIEMAHSLGLKVLAEGIETLEQLQILQLLGCDEGQGFFFNKPLSEQDFYQTYVAPFSTLEKTKKNDEKSQNSQSCQANVPENPSDHSPLIH